MSQNDDYIIITETPDPYSEEVAHPESEADEELSDASIRTLEEQGVTIISDQVTQGIQAQGGNSEPREKFSQELMNEGGIEIVLDDNEDDSLI